MSTCGVQNIREFHERAEVELISALSIREGKVHDIYQSTEPLEQKEYTDLDS
jgi:hypothetical protein